jgi:hypothetical protein
LPASGGLYSGWAVFSIVRRGLLSPKIGGRRPSMEKGLQEHLPSWSPEQYFSCLFPVGGLANRNFRDLAKAWKIHSRTGRCRARLALFCRAPIC